EDATQETFAAVWRAAASYDPCRGSGSAWLYAIARNAIVDQARARLAVTPDVPEVPADEPAPDEQAVAAWVGWRVHRAVEELPPQERTLIELADWGGRPQAEIAAELDMPLGTVKTRTRSALARLGEHLGDERLSEQPAPSRQRRRCASEVAQGVGAAVAR